MRLAVFAAALLALPLASHAQQGAQQGEGEQEAEAAAPTTEDSLGVWYLALTSRLSASQAAYSNWTEGGVSTLAFTAGGSGKANRTTRRWEQTYDLRLALGYIRQDSLELRKADDIIRLSASLQYEGGEGGGFFDLFNPTIAATARTQFTAGFNYDEVPSALQPAEGLRPPVKVADFMNPGIFTQTVGLTYDPRPWFTQRLGFSAKETFVTIRRLRPIYGLALGDRARIEAGLSSTTEVDRQIFEGVRLQSTLGLFMAFNETDQLPDATFENIVTMEVNDWLGVNFELTTLYDRDISRDLQIKEILSVGITFALI